MRIEVGSPVPLGPYDTVVVCSDGLVDNLHFEEISRTLRAGRLDRSLQQLVASAERRMTEPRAGEPSKPDDLSVIAYRRRPGADLMKRLPTPDGGQVQAQMAFFADDEP